MILKFFKLNAIFLYFALVCGAKSQAKSTSICSKGFRIVPFLKEPTNPNLRPKCYRFFNEKTTFEEAVDRCNRFKATLATPKHPIEADSLANFVLKNRPHTKRYWIGLTDQEEEGVFKWSDNGAKLSSNFSSWTGKEPDSDPAKESDRGDEQDCVKMAIWIFGRKSSAQFYDYHCNRYESFVCEKESNIAYKPVMEMIKESNQTALNTTRDPSKEVDFIVPKNASNSGGGMSGDNKNDENLYSEQNSTTAPMTMTAEYEGIKEGEEPEMPIVNPSSKLRPEVSDLPALSFETPIEHQLSNETSSESTGSELKPKIERRRPRRNCALQCMSNHMRAACPLKFFPMMKSTKVTLNNESCRPRRNGTHLIVYTKLDNCGTVVENIPKRGKLAFRNTIHVKTKGGAGIVRKSQMANAITELMVLECRYPQKHSVSHSYNLGDGKPPVYKTQAEGEGFDHVMFLYKSAEYECPYGREDYPVVMPLSERIFLEVNLDVESEMVELHPITCFATPDANPYNSNNYVLMQDGCIEDETFEIKVTEYRKLARMSVESFRFIGYFRQVYIHCKLLVCRINSESSPACPYACDPDRKNRARRESEDGDQRHLRREISSHSGMVKILNETEYLKISMEKVEANAEGLLSDGKGDKQDAPLPEESKKNERNSGAHGKPTYFNIITGFFLAKIFSSRMKFTLNI